MNNEYILAFITLISIIIGWFLNELSYYFRARGDKEKLLNEVLFNLMEIWYLVKSTNMDYIATAIDIYIKRLNFKFPEIQNDKEMADKLRPFLEQIAQELVPTTEPENIEKIKERYNNTIDSLSKIEPLIAYRLSNNPELYDYLSSLDERLKKIKNLFTNIDITIDEKKAGLGKILKPFIVERMLSILEKEIYLISAKISLLIWFKTMRKIQANIINAKELVYKIDEFLDNLRVVILRGSVTADTDFGEIFKCFKL